MDEVPLFSDYAEILYSGLIPLARTDAGRLIRELRNILPQAAAYAAETARLFP